MSESVGDISEVQKKQREMDIYREIAKGKIRMFFDSCANGRERIENLKKVNEEFLSLLKNRKDVEKALDICESIDNRDEFAERVSEILKPIIDLELEKYDQLNSGEKKRIAINEVFSYNVEGDIIQIHVFSGKKEYGIANKFIDGLRKLAKVVNENPDIKIIEAVSWIVSEHPSLIEKKMGFTIGGEVDAKYIKEHFPDDNREIKKAYITRGDFLNKYLV